MESFYIAIFISMVLVLFAIFSSLIAFRFGAPLLLLFLLIGIVTGVDGFGIEFSNYNLAYFIGSIALAVILFDSGFGTSLQSFRQAAAPALVLSIVGVLITSAIFGLAAMVLLGFSFPEGLLLGAIVGSTDAAAVFFLLRIGGIHIRDNVRSTLEVESGTNDPFAIFLTLTLVNIIAAGQSFQDLDLTLLTGFLQQMGYGLAFGFVGGVAIVALIKRFQHDQGLLPILVLAMALLVFSITGALDGSGFLAVYVAGLYAGNAKIQSALSIRRFQAGMTWLAQIIMFLVLGLLATPSQFSDILLPALALGLFLIFVARPVAVWLCIRPFRYTRRETGFVAWVGLRGAVSILLAILPVTGGLENGEIYFNAAFVIVLVSLVVQGWTIKPTAKRLGLIVPPRTGAVEKLEVDLPGAVNHELIAYRVARESPVLKGERIPRWARPSLVLRNGRSMRYQYAGRLQENDLLYLFVDPGFSRLLDRLFAGAVPVASDDNEFFGSFAISPSRPARELDAAYGPGLLSEAESEMTIAELINKRAGGQADYADRIRLGQIILIVREIDDNGRIASVGVSLEPVDPSNKLPPLAGVQVGWERLQALIEKMRRT
ncbi:potassium/proton antiporter [Rhizobium sp. PAMB 3174]